MLLRQLLSKDVVGIFAGDFNDRDDSFVDASGERGTSQTLAILKGSTMFNVGSLLPVRNRSSFAGGSLIDHILLPNELRSRVIRVVCENLPNVHDSVNERVSKFYSDHNPLMVEVHDSNQPSRQLLEFEEENASWLTILLLLVLVIVFISLAWRRPAPPTSLRNK
jgi:endonuclease/exonuclease/phosphatase family metal-dependent hydrolase